MDISKWQTVILEWVNCLNLTHTKVRHICDLKNEEFFHKLMALISMDPCECVSLAEFLKKYYPDYNLDNEPVLLQDDVEMCNMYSLLLHYCCIIDARPELTAPLCTNLQQNYQILIKTFLEEIHEAKEITRDLINDAIYNTNFLSTSFKSPVQESPQSPLLEFLKTPSKKQIFDSHKQEIKQLRAQLDLERFEKFDLQEELSGQYEKNKVLERNLQEKQAEIIQLRTERLHFDSSSSILETSPEKRLETKRLKHEVQSLEKYIELVSKEQIEMQNERDVAREKLRKVEGNYNAIQTQALALERNLLSLSEENEIHKSEIQSWKEKCEELTSLLHEYKSHKLEESYDTDLNMSGLIDNDNLARTVVDLQLSDVQKENKLLKQQIHDLETQFSDLHQQCEQLNHDNQQLHDKNSSLLLDNQEILAKLDGNNIELDTLRDELSVWKTKLCNSTIIYDKLFQTAFGKFNEQPSNVGESLFQVESFLEDIEQKFQLDSSQISNFRENCNNLSKKIQELQNEILVVYKRDKDKKDLKVNLDEAKTNIANLEDEVQKSNKFITICKTSLHDKTLEILELKDLLKEKDGKIEFYLNKLKDEKEIYEKRIKNLQVCGEKDNIKIQSLESQLKHLEQITDKLNQVKSQEVVLKEIISEKDKFIEKSCSCRKLLQAELEETKLSLLVAESKIEELESFIKDKTVEIERLHINNEKIIIGLHNENKGLQQQLATKEEDHSIEIAALKNSLELSKTDILALQEKVENKIIEVSKVSELIVSLESEKSKLLQDLKNINSLHNQQEKEKNAIFEALESVKMELADKMKFIKHLEFKKKQLEDCVVILNSQLNEEKASKCNLQEKCTYLEDIINNVENQMKALDIDKHKLNHQLEIIKNNPESKSKKNEDINFRIERLISELDIADRSNKSLHEKLEHMNLAVKEKETTLEQLLRRQDELQQEIYCLNQTLSETHQSRSDLQSEGKQLENKLNEKDQIIDQLRVDKIEIEKQIELTNQTLLEQQKETANKIKEITQLTEKLNIINVEISTIVYMFKDDDKKYEMSGVFSDTNLLPTVNDLKRNVCNLLMEKRCWNSECETQTQQTEQIKEYQKKLTDAQTQLEQSYCNTQELLKIHNNDIQVYQTEIQKLTENVHQLKEQIVQFRVQENYITEQLSTLKSELHNTVSDYQEALDNQEKTCCEYQHLQDEHLTLQNVVKDMKSNICSLETQIVSLNSQKLQAAQRVQKLEHVLNEKVKQMQAKEKIIQDLHAKLQAETFEKNKLIVQLLELNTNLSREIEQKETLTQRISEFEFKYETINRKLQTEITKNVELTEKVSQLSTSNDKLKQICIESSNKLDSLYFLVFATENNDLDASEIVEQLSNKLSKWSELCHENDQLKSKVASFEQEEIVFHEQIEDLKRNLMENEETQKTLQAEYQHLQENCNAELNKLEQELNSNQVQIKEHEIKYEKLIKEHENIKKKTTELEPELLCLQDKITNYQNTIQQLEIENEKLKTQLIKLKELEENNTEMSTKIEQYSQQSLQLEKTIEHLNERRVKDKKKFENALQKCSENAEKILENLRTEYEDQLKKMKEKVIRLYKEEMENQRKRQNEESCTKYEALKSEYDKLLSKYIEFTSKAEKQKQMIIEEVVTVQRKRRSITTVPADCFPTAEEEDGDLWSSTYLNDLKVGNCNPRITENRLSELQQRNMKYLPHMRSSYHPELQFASPERIHEEDIKNLTGMCKKAISNAKNHTTQEPGVERRRLKHKDEVGIPCHSLVPLMARVTPPSVRPTLRAPQGPPTQSRALLLSFILIIGGVLVAFVGHFY